MLRKSVISLPISNPAVTAAVREPLNRSVLEVVRRFTRAATPKEIGQVSGIGFGELRRALDLLEEAGMVGRRPVDGDRREPTFFATGDSFLITFDTDEASLVEELDALMGEYARSATKRSRGVRPVGVPGFHFRAYLPLKITSDEVIELKGIMHRLDRFMEKVSSRQQISEELEPQDCNYQLQFDVGPAAPGLLPLAPIYFVPSSEAPALEKLVKERRLDRLTPREKEVAVAMSQGWSRPEIAAQLGLSVNTVASVGKRVYAKLGVSRRTELAVRLNT
jgi:DNA-binding CsgD family transcriptional regulator